MAQESSARTRQLKTSPPAIKMEKYTILVVDDEPLVLDFLLEYLKQDNLTIVSASCGEEALAVLKQTPADIAIIDLKMPGIDGLQTIEKINQIDASIVTILMTGFPTLDSSVRAIRLGASDYILKPFKLDEVDLALRKAMKEREVRREMSGLRQRIVEMESRVTGKNEQIVVNHKVNNMIFTRNGKS